MNKDFFKLVLFIIVIAIVVISSIDLDNNINDTVNNLNSDVIEYIESRIGDNRSNNEIYNYYVNHLKEIEEAM